MQTELFKSVSVTTSYDERYIVQLINSGMTFETAAAVYSNRVKAITTPVLKHLYFKAKDEEAYQLVKRQDGHIKRPKRQCPVCGSYRCNITDYRPQPGLDPSARQFHCDCCRRVFYA